MFATLLYVELDSAHGTMVLSNGGHLPPIIRRADGSIEKASGAGGAPLGILQGMRFGQEKLLLSPGDIVVLYTDGIVEAMNAADEQYGYARFTDVIRKAPPEPAALKDAVVADVSRFTGLSEQHDDLTLVCFGPSRR